MLGTRSSLTLCMRWGLRAVVACCAYQLLAPVPSVLPFPGGDLRGPGQARPHAEPGRTWALSLPLHGPQVPLQEDSALHACDPTPAESLNNGARPKAALRRLSRAETRSDRVWGACWLVGLRLPKSALLAEGDRAVCFSWRSSSSIMGSLAGTLHKGLTQPDQKGIT